MKITHCAFSYFPTLLACLVFDLPTSAQNVLPGLEVKSSIGHVNGYASLPVRTTEADITHVSELPGLKIQRTEPGQPATEHYVLEVRYVRRGDDVICTDYAAVAVTGSCSSIESPR